MAARILAVDDNLVNLKVVGATLNHAGYEVDTASSGPEALALVEKMHYDLIILDITMPDMDGYEVCQRLRANPATATVPVMMLTAHDSLEEKIRGFEIGADDYLTKPFQPMELLAHVKVLIRRVVSVVQEAPAATACKVISVFSLRGGVGVSTTATNLAAALAQIWRKPVALIDLSLVMGQSAVMLNLPLRNTWVDLVQSTLSELDPDMILRILLQHESGVSVLAAPRHPEEAELVTPDLVRKVIELLKKKFAYIVIDLPHDFRETTLAGLDESDEILALMAPELASVRAMAGSLDVFSQLKYPATKTRIILNWTFERRGLARKEIEGVLKSPIQLMIPFAPETFVSAINLGVPPVLGGPANPICILYEDLAYKISREDDTRERPASPSPAYLRMEERLHLHQQPRK